MPATQIILWIIVALAPIATVFALLRIITGPRIISKLMIRYLMKRRIAWVSLIAVMLCTAMVLIVISVMGGWLRMFRQTNHDLIGDLIVYRSWLDGFSHYQDMIADIEKIPEIEGRHADDSHVAPGRDRPGGHPDPIHMPVEVFGLDIKQIGQVNGFVRSLHLQKDVLLAKADDFARDAAKNSVPFEAAEDSAMADSFRAKAANFPSFDKPLAGFRLPRSGIQGRPGEIGAGSSSAPA